MCHHAPTILRTTIKCRVKLYVPCQESCALAGRDVSVEVQWQVQDNEQVLQSQEMYLAAHAAEVQCARTE